LRPGTLSEHLKLNEKFNASIERDDSSGGQDEYGGGGYSQDEFEDSESDNVMPATFEQTTSRAAKNSVSFGESSRKKVASDATGMSSSALTL